jgi:hypothetical protein
MGTDNAILLSGNSYLALGSDNTERMRIDSSGNFMVGTSTADVFGRFDDRYATLAATLATDNIALNISSGATASRGAQIYMGTGSTRHFTIGANNDDSYLGTSSNKPLRFLTNDVERMRITASGVLELTQGQIKFPATQVASADPNTLDDYEEGTWTPTVTSAGYTASSSSGSYTRVGRIVHIRGAIEFSAVDASSTSRANIGGLPFTTAETTAGWGREETALGHLFAFRVDALTTVINSIDGVVTASNVPFATSRTYIFGASYRV